MLSRDRRTIHCLLQLLVAAAVCTVPGLAAELPVARPEEVGLDPGRLARLDVAMQEAVAERRVAGVVTVVMRRGRVAHYTAYGLADVESNRRLRRDDMFRLYSMTKPVVSVALLMLFEEGKFQLGEPLEKFIPSFATVKVLASVDDGGRMVLDRGASPRFTMRFAILPGSPRVSAPALRRGRFADVRRPMAIASKEL